MADTYVHGIVFDTKTGTSRQIRSPSTSVIGIVGTAPSASAELPVETPKVFFKEKAALLAAGDLGSLRHAIKGAFSKGDVTLVIVRAKSDSLADIETAIDKLCDAESITGYKPKILSAGGLMNMGPAAAIPPGPAFAPVIAPAEVTINTKRKELVNA